MCVVGVLSSTGVLSCAATLTKRRQLKGNQPAARIAQAQHLESNAS